MGGFSNERRTTVSKVKNTNSPIQLLRIMGWTADSEGMSKSGLLRASLTLTSDENVESNPPQSSNRNERLSRPSAEEPALRSGRKPTRRGFLVSVIAVLVVVILLVYMLPFSSVRIEVLTGPSYGAVQLTISLDGVAKTHANISATTGAFSSLYTVPSGRHTILIHWDRAMDGLTDETKTFVVGPFSSADIRFSHGAGWG